MTERQSHPQDVTMEVRREGQSIVLELAGEIDMRHAVMLRNKCLQLLRDEPPVFVVNMANVQFMDSSGVATLVEALKRCRRCGCQLRLAEMGERVRNVFEICRLESIFDIYESEGEALS